jgi:ABC-type multidrug transport system fused ATPase/permease subunit
LDEAITKKMRADVFRALLRQERCDTLTFRCELSLFVFKQFDNELDDLIFCDEQIGYFDQNQTGILVSKLAADVTLIQDSISEKVAQV